MPVVFAKEIPDRQADSSGTQSDNATRTWRVRVDTLSNIELFNAGAAVFPPLYSPHPVFSNLTLKRQSVEGQGGYVYLCKAYYDGQPIEFEEEEQASNPSGSPLDRDVYVYWTTQTVTVPRIKDRFGDAILNSAGDYYDPPAERELDLMVFNFRKNYDTPPAFMRTLLNSTNDTAITILGVQIDEQSARFRAAQGPQLRKENGISYYVCEWTVETFFGSAQLELLDQGVRVTDASGDVTHALDDNGDPVSTPVLLDGNGERLASPTPQNAVYRTHEDLQPQDYTVLPGVT